MTHISIPTSASFSALEFGGIITVDVSSFTGPDDYISLSLPEFPATKLDLSQTFIDFTSNETGDFGIGPIDQIAFDQAISVPVTDGDTEIRFSIGLLETIDTSAITGIRFRIYANSDCIFRCLSIRACAAEWLYAPIDLDTLWNRIQRPPTPDGSDFLASEFPVSGDISWPSDFPILWRSDDLTEGAKDPRPIDISVSTAFTTGSLTFATGAGPDHFNVFAQYFRDTPTDDQIMVELNSITQADLNIKGAQPDFGRAGYVTRDQENLNAFEQEDLEDDTQFDIERLPDYSEHTWLVVRLSWCADSSSNTLEIMNADEEGYTFTDIDLEPSVKEDLDQGEYIMLTDLKGSTIRVRIYGLDQIENIDESNLVFDTGLINDDILIKRRKGRVGWWAQLVDGDAFINDIRTRGINFGEIVTKEFQSITPVKGVSLYAGTTSNKELLTEIAPAPWSSPVSIGLDPGASLSGKAYKITSSPQYSLQGISSNPFLLDDPSDLDISFDLRFPSAGTDLPGGSLTAFLLGPNSRAIPINLSAFKKDIWSKVKVTILNGLFQTGIYRLILLQTKPVVTTTWWLENLSIRTSTVKWFARSHSPDAWGSPEENWVSAGSTLNSLNGGIVFPENGNGLQVRGQASRQEALISDFKAVPQYATLGRFAWDDDTNNNPGYEPTAFFSATKKDQTVTVQGSGFDADGTVTSYFWNFGDDHYDSGMSAVHTYARAGTYTITLVVNDDYGNLASYQSSVTVP